MRILSLIIFFAILFLSRQKTESPHGDAFKISCSACHSSKGWQLDKEIYSFNHNQTRLPLVGQHAEIDCRLCHQTLVFSEAKTECNQCHNDIHQQTTGLDCSRCHTPASWLVNNINEIHRSSRFPLLGAHRLTDCYQCHKSETLVRFDVTGINCIDCHRQDYIATSNPNHPEAGFSEDCSTCHPVNSFQWTGTGFNHNFFPLVQGHSMPTCADCHATGHYSDASPDCNSCHNKDYIATNNPNHTSSNFPVTCQNCHTLNPGWKPASFDHNRFPLTLGHANISCADCHKGGNYSLTSADCNSCHNTDYNNSANPNHQTLGFSLNCTQCHNTNPGWKPAAYTQHDSQFFPIYSGRHRGQWSQCSDCHSNPANYALFNCISCHRDAHRERNYTDAQCYSCHPRGTGD